MSDGDDRRLTEIYQDMNKIDSFLGKGWSFPPEFLKGKRTTVMVAEEEDIYQSLMIILKTAPGERIHRFDFGCGINRYVHEEMILTVQTMMKDVIYRAILMYEPRVTLDNIFFDLSREVDGLMDVRLEYTVRKTNARSNIVFPFYLREGTDVKR